MDAAMQVALGAGEYRAQEFEGKGNAGHTQELEHQRALGVDFRRGHGRTRRVERDGMNTVRCALLQLGAKRVVA